MTEPNTMTANDTAPKLWTAKDVARVFQCSPRAVAAWTASGDLASVKLGRLRRYRPEDVEAFIRSSLSGGQ